MERRVTIDVDAPDDAIRSALDPAQAHTRADLVRRALVVGGTLTLGGIAVGGIPHVASSAPSPAQDVRILNLVLLLEYLEEAFYADALKRGALKGELRQYARVVGGHERAHVKFIDSALGSAARKRPRFAFGDATRSPAAFTAAALALEDLSVAAYNGQATNLTKKTLAAAARIVSVEARHAAWIRFVADKVPAPDPTDKPATAAAVTKRVEKTKFVRTS